MFQFPSLLDRPWQEQMGEEGEGDDGAAAGEIRMELDTCMERLHLQESEDMASGGNRENVSEELLEVSVGECSEPCANEVKSPTRSVGLKAESIESVKYEEEKVVKILSKKEEKKKVPRHRRFWESSDCSCSKEVFFISHQKI